MNASVLMDFKAKAVRSPYGKMSPLMADGVAGQTGLRALEDRKQDRGSATIHLLKMGAAPARDPLQKHSPVKEGRASSTDSAVGCT